MFTLKKTLNSLEYEATKNYDSLSAMNKESYNLLYVVANIQCGLEYGSGGHYGLCKVSSYFSLMWFKWDKQINAIILSNIISNEMHTVK